MKNAHLKNWKQFILYVDHASGDEDQEDRGDEGVDYEELRPTFTHEALCRLVDLDLVKHVVMQSEWGWTAWFIRNFQGTSL